MAVGIGNLGRIVQDFSDNLNQIFGTGGGKNPEKGGPAKLTFNPIFGGPATLEPKNWTGNAKGKKFRYGFAQLTLDEIKARMNVNGSQGLRIPGKSVSSAPGFTPFYLEIPPQNISQREIFATNISATKKGVIVESEGVVFKDIIIEGTTGIFPLQRGSSTSPKSQFFKKGGDLTKPPGEPAGVDENGLSTAAVTGTSGYEEFLRLRQYFLTYARFKTYKDGDRFLVFINEKDNQTLIVEPIEFNMIRSSSKPMMYDYRIVLKAIGNLNDIFKAPDNNQKLNALEQIGNISANIVAAIKQSREVINRSVQTLERFSQAIDQTFLDPLRQLQFAMEDLSDGTSRVLSLPSVLVRNYNDTTLNVRENKDKISQSINDSVIGKTTKTTSTQITNARSSTGTTTAIEKEALSSPEDFNKAREILSVIENSAREPIPRNFLVNLRTTAKELADDLEDSLNLGDDFYNEIYHRTPTTASSPLKRASDDELLLLSTLRDTIATINQALATNNMFQADIEVILKKEESAFNNQIKLPSPSQIREVTVMRGDTLEKIALREYGDALRWVDIAVLNKLVTPYLSETKSKGVIKYGDPILIGN